MTMADPGVCEGWGETMEVPVKKPEPPAQKPEVATGTVVRFMCSFCGKCYDLLHEDPLGAVARTSVAGCAVCKPRVNHPPDGRTVVVFPLIEVTEAGDEVPAYVIGPPESHPVGH